MNHRLREVAVDDVRLDDFQEAVEYETKSRLRKTRPKRDGRRSPRQQVRLLRRLHPRNK